MAARLAWTVLICTTLYICYFHNLGAVGLVGPDEPRYAWIARDMAETGDWVTPRLYGKPWFEKPVLYYWGAALSFKLFGVSEAPARLPSAICALLSTLALAWLALRLYGSETARWLLLLLPTTVGMIGLSHAAAMDMPFAGMLTIAMVWATVILGLTRNANMPILPRTPWLALLFFGFFLGLAVLAKGPAAIILSGGAVLFWALFTKRWRDAFRCLHPAVIASFCLTALPWYILCDRRNPDFFRIFIIEHNFKRYLTPEFQHIQPFWFYVPVLLIGFVPWAFVLLWSITVGLWHRARKFSSSPAALFLLSWSMFCLFFFSFSRSKLPGYILPAIPPAGLLLARSIVIFAPEGERTFRWLRFVFSFLALPAAVVLFWASRSFDTLRMKESWMLSTALIALLMGFANFLLANKVSRNKTLRLVAFLCVAPVLILVAGFHSLARPWLVPDPSGKSIALELERSQTLGPDFSLFYVSSMKRGQQYSLSFYLHREIPSWDPSNPTEGLLLLPENNDSICRAEVPAHWSCSRKSIELNSTGWSTWRVLKPTSIPSSH